MHLAGKGASICMYIIMHLELSVLIIGEMEGQGAGKHKRGPRRVGYNNSFCSEYCTRVAHSGGCLVKSMDLLLHFWSQQISCIIICMGIFIYTS